jgi:hypothetical protein
MGSWRRQLQAESVEAWGVFEQEATLVELGDCLVVERVGRAGQACEGEALLVCPAHDRCALLPEALARESADLAGAFAGVACPSPAIGRLLQVKNIGREGERETGCDSSQATEREGTPLALPESVGDKHLRGERFPAPYEAL